MAEQILEASRLITDRKIQCDDALGSTGGPGYLCTTLARLDRERFAMFVDGISRGINRRPVDARKAAQRKNFEKTFTVIDGMNSNS